MAWLRKPFLLLLALLLTLAACAAPVDAPTEAPQETVFPSIEPQDAPNRAEPLVNRHAYAGPQDVHFDVEQLYIKIYPTYDEDGDLITREEFERHSARRKDFNPTLNAHLWQGDPADKADIAGRFGFDDSLYNCTIRVRGNSSRAAAYKSFKIKLSQPGANLFGVDSLNLNKHFYDDTRTGNKTAMDLMQMIESGMVSFETRFVHLFINDVDTDGTETGFQDQGLYVWIEQPNRDFLINHGLDPHGTMYKPNLFEFSDKYEALRTEDDPLYDAAAFEAVIRPMANPNHAKLIDMLRAINDYSRDYREVFATYFDEENYLTWMATNILFGNADTLTHNLLLYSPSGSSKWYFLPWDYDEALKYSDVYHWGERPYPLFGIHHFWSTPVHQRYFRIEGNTEKLQAKIDELLATVFTQENFEALTAGYLEVLDEYLPREAYLGMTRQTNSLKKKGLWNSDTPGRALVVEGLIEQYRDILHTRYQAVRNNAERYTLTLQYPSSIFMQDPVKVEEGWFFQWEASFDHQRDRLTYELILSTGYARVDPKNKLDYKQTGIFFRRSDLTSTGLIVPSLPAGPVYYRVLVHDGAGHAQYPRNVTYIYLPDETIAYHAIGLYVNE